MRERTTDVNSFAEYPPRLLAALCTSAMIGLAGICVGTLTSTLPLPLTLMAFAGSLALLLAFIRPDLALYLFFCGTIMLTDFSMPPPVEHFSLPDADIISGLPSALTTFFLLMFCVILARNLIIERDPPPVSLRALGVYTVILMLSLATSLAKGTEPSHIRLDFIGMLFPVLCFYLCVSVLNSLERIYRLLTVMMVAATLKATILAGFYLAGRGWPYATYRIVTLDSTDLLVFITLGLIAIHLITRRDIRGFRAAIIAAACIPMLFAIIFSYRRAQWVGSVFSLGLLFWGASKAIRRRTLVYLLIAIFFTGTIVALAAAINEEKITLIASRLTSIFDKNQPSNFYHLEESKQVLLDLAESPFLGLGLGSQHSPLGLYKHDTVSAKIVHNTFLYIWMKLGLPGLLFFGWVSVLYARRIFRFRKTGIESEQWGILLPLAASSGLWLAMFLTSPIPWYLHQTYLKALFAAIVISLIMQAENSHPKELALQEKDDDQ